mgnify:CR=1 FL=1
MNTVVINIAMTQPTIMEKMIKKFTYIFTIILVLSSCASTSSINEPRDNFFKTQKSTLLEQNFSGLKKLNYIDVLKESNKDNISLGKYTIQSGDTLNIIVYGQDEIFPTSIYQANSPLAKKNVDENGYIYFPYVGRVRASGYTIDEFRQIITQGLAKDFIDPKVDIAISEFNSRRQVYVFGEVLRPQTIKLSLVRITLAEALSFTNGLSPATADSSAIYVVRKISKEEGNIYRMDLSELSNLIIANEFVLEPGDIIYVGSSNITKWNRFISQLFPFTSFFNQLDYINRD